VRGEGGGGHRNRAIKNISVNVVHMHGLINYRDTISKKLLVKGFCGRC
jgi:hypothetical protein